MGKPAAKQGDKVVGTDTHVLLTPTPTPVTMPFNGPLDGALSPNVIVEHHAAAVKGSTATNDPPHAPTLGPFEKPPSNKGTVSAGSATVLINNKPAARNGDTAITCNDPADAPNGTIVATSTVLVG